MLLAGCALAAIACRESPRNAETNAAVARCGPEARRAVDRLGARMRLVSLLAPDSIVRRELLDAYAPLVTADLLDAWQRSPSTAPGRQVSNPWPARIDIRTVQPNGSDCLLGGDVVYVTSTDTLSAVERRPVTLTVSADSGWRVSSYSMIASTAAAAPLDSNTPAQIIRRYYAAIDSGNYAVAYELWGQRGQASGQTREQFAAGFAQTARVRATVGDSVRVEGAAGSQYATVPVVIEAALRSGERQRFTGTYTLRRAMVDGATAEQRQWHIYKAELRKR